MKPTTNQWISLVLALLFGGGAMLINPFLGLLVGCLAFVYVDMCLMLVTRRP